jgi:hypothetical protein
MSALLVLDSFFDVFGQLFGCFWTASQDKFHDVFISLLD